MKYSSAQLPIHFLTSGKGQPFFFQHGLGSNLLQPQGILRGLDDFQLISMDCPGHGTANLQPDCQPSFDFYADQLVGLMEGLGIKQAVFGGISMGAGISINIALRYPEKVKALVLVRPAWLDKKQPDNLDGLKDAAKLIPIKNGKQVFEQGPAFQTIQKTLPNAAASILGVFSPTQQDVIPFVLESMYNDRPFNDRAELKKITQPSLIIANEDDPLHPFAMAQEIQKWVAGSQLVKIVSRYIDNEAHRKAVYSTVHEFVNTL